MLYILKLVCLLQNNEKMVYILKIVCLLQKNGKNGYVVHIKTSMLIAEITGMLYIRHHKIRFLRVLHRERDSAK